MQPEKVKLKNKLETLFINSPGSTSACIQIWFRAGSALEKKNDLGIAHFLEHMFFKGTKKYPGFKIAQAIEGVGGELNAFTSFDYTCYYVNVPNSHILLGTEIIMEMVSKPTFNSNEIPSERDVVQEEFRKTLDNPGQFAFLQIQKNCFTNGYKHPILGNPKTIAGFTKKQLIEFRKKFYNISNALLVVAGDLGNKNKITQLIERYKIHSGETSKFPPFKINNKPALSIHHRDVRMSQINLIFQGLEFTNSMAPAEDLAFNCLGHGETSRLYSELVLQTSLANTCTSSTMFFSHGSLHFIRIVFPHKNLKKIISKIKTILNDILKTGLNKVEIERIKNQYSSSRIYDKESLESYAFSLGHSYAQFGEITDEENFINRIKKTSFNNVNLAINEIFKRNINIVAQIPKNESLQKMREELEQFENYFTHTIGKKVEAKTSKEIKSISNHDPQLQLIKIRPGINLLYRQNTMTPTFVLHAYLKGGLIEEKNIINGSYNLLTSLLTRGYNNIPYDSIKQELENRSASFQSFSGKNAYGLTMHGQTEHASDLFEIFTGSMTNPDMPQGFLEHEKQMVLRSLENQKEDPARQCFNRVGELMFEGHPYALDMLGTPKSIETIEQKYLLDIHEKNMNQSDILFTYCGDLELQNVLELVNKNLTKLNPRKISKYTPIKYFPSKNLNHVIPFDREQTQIFIGLPIDGMKSNTNLYLKIITTFLSGQSSKLFVEIRDKLGLCYVIQPVHFQAIDGGYWGIYMACSPDKVNNAINKIKEIIHDIASKSIAKTDFFKVKKMIKGQSLLGVQTNEDYANIYSIPFFYGIGVDYFYKKNIIIDNMNFDDFKKNICKILNKKLFTVVVGKK
ncbi:MAG: insulinase family protein [Bacteriovoracaceae bacterium]|nr:insulinase family protein [Bacteriovoracaceae bacterium]